MSCWAASSRCCGARRSPPACASARPKGIFAELGEKPEPVEIVRIDGDRFLVAEPVQGMHRAVVFLGDDGRGNARYLHGGRASRRVGR